MGFVLQGTTWVSRNAVCYAAIVRVDVLLADHVSPSLILGPVSAVKYTGLSYRICLLQYHQFESTEWPTKYQGKIEISIFQLVQRRKLDHSMGF